METTNKRIAIPSSRACARLPSVKPLHLEATVRLLQRRPANLIDLWDGQCYRRVLRTREGPVRVEVRNHSTVDAPDLQLRTFPSDLAGTTRTEIAQAVDRMLGLTVDPAPFQQRLQAEPPLRTLALALRGMRPPQYPELFEAFANAIPFQQLSIEAGMAVVGRLVRRFGEVFDHDGHPYWVFPSSHAVAVSRTASLERCGLSARKAQALRDVARAIESGALTAEQIRMLPTPEALERLMRLRGIGAWSAALVLLRGFGRLDVFPSNDVGAEGGLLALLHLRSRKRLRGVIDRFGDVRGYLYFCALANRLLTAGLIHAAPLREVGPARKDTLRAKGVRGRV